MDNNWSLNQSRIKIKCIELWFEPDYQIQDPIIIIKNIEISLIVSWK